MSRALVKFAILKCTDKGRGSYVEPPASNNTILHILPLKNGGIAYGSFDPASGVFDKHDRLVVFKAPYIGDYNGNWNGFLLSYNGFIVQFGYETFENYQPAFMCLTAFLN